MIRNIYILLLGLCISIVACSDNNKEDIDSSFSAPVIKFPLEQLDIDLNKVDNLPIVAIVKSQAGLKNITMKIQTTESIQDYKTVTEFFNSKSYSLSETLEYEQDFQSFIIEAIDNLGQKTISTLPISVTGIVERPTITFDPNKIVYDEMDENPTIPRTTFKVTSEAGLKKIEMFLVSSLGQNPIGTAELNGEKEYSFDEMINYKEGDKGFKVKAEDSYGYITITTLPITYKIIPGPELKLKSDIIFAETGIRKAIPMQINSVRGVHEIIIYRIEEGNEVEAFRKKMNGETTLDYSPEIALTETTSKIKVVISDGRVGKEAIAYAKAYVDMDVVTLNIGSQNISNTGHEKYPDALGLVSLNDLKTYSIDYAISSEDNAKNVDFKFYCFGGSAVPRLYSMDNTEKSSEYSGSTGKLSALKIKNMTRFAILSNFDYENATVSSISNILSSSISTSKLTPFEIGDIIAFRTGSSSTAGGSRVGIMKVINITAPKELSTTNPTIRVLTLEIKFPKKK